MSFLFFAFFVFIGVSDKHVCAGVTNIPGEIEDLEISIQGVHEDFLVI